VNRAGRKAVGAEQTADFYGEVQADAGECLNTVEALAKGVPSINAASDGLSAAGQNPTPGA